MSPNGADGDDPAGIVTRDDAGHALCLPPDDTGLPLAIWVGQRFGINQAQGTPATWPAPAVWRANPRGGYRLTTDGMSQAEAVLVNRWIALNEMSLVAYWDYRIGAAELVRQLRRLPS